LTLPRCDVRCERLGFAARSLLRGIASGEESDEEITARLRARFGPRTPVRLELADAACRGPSRGAVQLVVFSDFQCPYCSLARVLVEILERRATTPLQVCFKHYPLVTMHRQARLAAQATVAAQLQGKFWPLHDRLFSHPKELERQQLSGHARAVGLDLPRFERDLDSHLVRLRVERDRSEAIALKVAGTPTFFIDGHEMIDPKSVPDFLDWIAEAALLRRQDAARERQMR
jgi:protein-disulfide isomerase